ncbi:MAG: OPT/YSL family transporter [Planctomycetota bacterium]
MSSIKLDKELQEFRDIMKVPAHFEEGFSWTALVAALFIALLMVPGATYMGLLIGQGVGGSAQWVTVILFLEIARRAHKSLKRSEIYILYMMAGAAMGQPFSGLLWNQYFVNSQAAVGAGVAEHLKEIWWYAPTDPVILAQRNFFHPAWYPVLGMIVFSTVINRFNQTVLTYGMFRIASDIEKLPFPMAPVGASGIVALAEQQVAEDDEAESVGEDGMEKRWRWRVFCIGAVMGLAFGVIYAALPAVSTAVLDGKRIMLLEVPFVDFTAKTGQYLPAFATGWSWDLGNFIGGMVMPFFAVLGGFIGLIVTLIANPLLYQNGMLPSWEQGMDTIRTSFNNTIDFYFSFSIGVSIAIAIAGFYQVFRSLRDRRKQKDQEEQRLVIESDEDMMREAERIAERGDIPAPLIVATYFIVCFIYIGLCGWLIEWHRGVMIALVFFAFLYTPIISYVTARLQGMAGMSVGIPMVKEAAFLLSGYSGGVKIWFLPTPFLNNYGGGAQGWRTAELTGTRFWSIWKTEIILTPIVLLASIVFAQFLWSLGPIPSSAYPYAQKMWPLNAAGSTIIMTSTLGKFSQFEETFHWEYLLVGAGFGSVMFFVLYAMNLPIMLVYGMVGGLNQTLPHSVIPQFIGALIGRFYFQRKLGVRWRRYIPVVMAGFGCGLGLITMFCVGVTFMTKAVIDIPF